MTSSQEMPCTRLYAFGAFHLLTPQGTGEWLDLADSRLWGHGRAQDLLLLLLLRQRPLARVEAAATLWPEAEVSHRARLLRNALWNLRQALHNQATLGSSGSEVAPSQLVLREAQHTLHLQVLYASAFYASSHTQAGEISPSAKSIDVQAGPIWSDVQAFEFLAQQTRASQDSQERLRLGGAALQLYAGPFLPHRQDASWISSYRLRLHTRWVELSLMLATDWRRGGQRDLALESLLNVLDRDPEQVEVARRAMILLGEMGRTRDALDLYERIRRSYRGVFGADPIELKRLAAQLRTGVDTIHAGQLTRESGARWKAVRPGHSTADD